MRPGQDRRGFHWAPELDSEPAAWGGGRGEVPGPLRVIDSPRLPCSRGGRIDTCDPEGSFHVNFQFVGARKGQDRPTVLGRYKQNEQKEVARQSFGYQSRPPRGLKGQPGLSSFRTRTCGCRDAQAPSLQPTVLLEKGAPTGQKGATSLGGSTPTAQHPPRSRGC